MAGREPTKGRERDKLKIQDSRAARKLLDAVEGDLQKFKEAGSYWISFGASLMKRGGTTDPIEASMMLGSTAPPPPPPVAEVVQMDVNYDDDPFGDDW